MVYLGSKARIAKELVPIIESHITDTTSWYIEPFVGGANVIDKISHPLKVGYDVNEYLIALLQQVQSDVTVLPATVSEDEYHLVRGNKAAYPDWYVGLVGFCATFGSKYFGGFARSKGRDDCASRIRNLVKQAPNLKNISFVTKSYQDIDVTKLKNCVIYCDPPYKGTTPYKTDPINHEHFYDWCRELSKHNTVLISEYEMPDDFECIWEKEHFTNFDSNRTAKSTRIERLYRCKR